MALRCGRGIVRKALEPHLSVAIGRRGFFLPAVKDENTWKHILQEHHGLTRDMVEGWVRYIAVPWNKVSSTSINGGTLIEYEAMKLHAKVFVAPDGSKWLSNAWVKGHNVNPSIVFEAAFQSAQFGCLSAVVGGGAGTYLAHFQTPDDFKAAALRGGLCGTALGTSAAVCLLYANPLSLPASVGIGFAVGFSSGYGGATLNTYFEMNRRKKIYTYGYMELLQDKHVQEMHSFHQVGFTLHPADSSITPARATSKSLSLPTKVDVPAHVAVAGAAVFVASKCEDGQDVACGLAGGAVGAGVTIAAVGAEAATACTVAVVAEVGGTALTAMCPPVAIAIGIGGLIGIAISQARKK